MMIVTLLTMFFVVALAPYMIISIPSGKTGVLWKRFEGGTQIIPGLPEGVHIIFPWDKIFVYDARVQLRSADYEVISKDGLHISVSVSFRFRIQNYNVALLHKHVGPRYADVVLIPEIGSVTRLTIATYDAEPFFADRRTEVQDSIYSQIISTDRHNLIGGIGPDQGIFTGMYDRDGHRIDKLGIPSDPSAAPSQESVDEYRTGPDTTDGLSNFVPEDFIRLVDFLITNVQLPATVRRAIENKHAQKQIVQEYEFRVRREFLESRRKEIEALGIQRFQKIVQSGISDTYLKWRGIEATLNLATSPNAKVVVIGSGESGLPLILNTGSTPMDDGTSAGLGPINLDEIRKKLDAIGKSLGIPKMDTSSMQGYPDPASDKKLGPNYPDPALDPALKPNSPNPAKDVPERDPSQSSLSSPVDSQVGSAKQGGSTEGYGWLDYATRPFGFRVVPDRPTTPN